MHVSTNRSRGATRPRAVRLGLGAAAVAAALAAVPATASANASCVYDPSTKAMTITPGASDLRLFRGADGSIQSELLGQGFSLPCFQPGDFTTVATVLNTDKIEITNNEGSGNRLIIDQSAGSFAPGATINGADVDPRVEIVNKATKWGSVELIGTGASELIQVGALGVSNTVHEPTVVRFHAPHPLGNVDQGSDSGRDFVSEARDVPLYVVDGGGGNDTITGLGAPFPQVPGAERHRLRLRGGDGDDFLVAGRSGAAIGTVTPAPAADELNGGAGNDTLMANNALVSNLVRGGTGTDVAKIDSGDSAFPDVERVERAAQVGRLALAPRSLEARAGRPTRVTLSWTHPTSWRDLRKVDLLVTDAGGKEVGRLSVRPNSEQVSAHGALAAASVTHKGRTVRAQLDLRLARPLAADRLAVHVRATDRRGRAQLERSAGVIHVR